MFYSYENFHTAIPEEAVFDFLQMAELFQDE